MPPSVFQPQNLLLTGPFPNCDVKLCDFGISRQVSGGGELREIMGTADYMGKQTMLRRTCPIMAPVSAPISVRVLFTETLTQLEVSGPSYQTISGVSGPWHQ